MPWNGKRFGGGWTTWMHSAKAKSRKAVKDEISNAKLIAHCPTTVYMGHRMQTGISCKTCIHFETCPKAGKQDYCLYRPGRYQSKHLMQNQLPSSEKNPDASS